MAIVTARGLTNLGAIPELYSVYRTTVQPPQPEWIIEGTDSNLYMVPAEPGGWMRRCEYHGPVEELEVVSQKKARSICWSVYGDVGRVTMEGANLEPR